MFFYPFVFFRLFPEKEIRYEVDFPKNANVTPPRESGFIRGLYLPNPKVSPYQSRRPVTDNSDLGTGDTL